VPGEQERLQYFLDQQRAAVLAILDGLDEEQMHSAVLPSGWTPLGLIVHLAGAEATWFQTVVLGEEPHMVWSDGIEDPPYDPDAAFTTDHSAVEVIRQYRRQCEISNEILRTHALETGLLGDPGFEWPGEPITDLRWVALHMIEETARHAGHLDAVRELLDGVTGRGPR
jgi:hypothetical protein